MNRFKTYGERLWAQAEADYRRRLLELLPRDPGARLLDLGCEDGAWTDTIRRTIGIPPNQVTAIEIVPADADLAERRGFTVHRTDLEGPWPLPDHAFTVVHANQVIEHLVRVDHFAEEIQRVLHPQGIALICTENLASWHNVAALAGGLQPFSITNLSELRPIGNPLALHADRSPREVTQAPLHVHVMTLTALRDLFRAHGFAIRDAWGTGYHPLPGRLASWAARIDPRHAHFIAVTATHG
jgi:SAM-dependent methyltransferase